MPQYRYTVVDKSNQRLTKIVAAASQESLARSLESRGVFIVKIVDISQQAKQIGRHLTASDRLFMVQNIAILLDSGISLGEVLNIIAADTANKRLALFFQALQSDLEQGSSFSQALSGYPEAFDEVFLSLIEAGESSGQLSLVLQNLAESLERDMQTVRQVKSALIYPVIILGALALLVGILSFFVLPKLVGIFTQVDFELPWLTRQLINLGQFIELNQWLALLLYLGSLAAIVGWSLSPWGKRLLRVVSGRLPVIKNVYAVLDLTRLSSTLELLLRAGIPIQAAMKNAAGTLTDQQSQLEVVAVSTKLQSGISLAQSLGQTHLPRTFIALIATGEQSGSLEKILKSLSGHYQRELETKVKDLTAVLEPALTLFVGLTVAGAVLTILVPLYQFIGSFQNVG